MNDISQFRIIFLGTPDFAVASLKALLGAGANIVGVITAPDKPAGRGKKLNASPIKEFALENGLTILQPKRLKAKSFLLELRALEADLQIVVAFRMLPEAVWNMPRLGTINVHGSLLPNYRGAAPINWAIINGEKKSGVSTFLLQHEIDTGAILLQKEIPILPEDNFGTMYYKLMELGAELLVETLTEYLQQKLVPKPQPNNGEELHAPKIYKETGLIDWDNNTEDINNLIRGLNPIPGAYTIIKGKMLKIWKAIPIESEVVKSGNPGEIDSDNKTSLHFKTKDAWLSLLEIQYEGKKRMPIADFLRGFKLD